MMTAKTRRVNVCQLMVIVGGLEFAVDGAVGDGKGYPTVDEAYTPIDGGRWVVRHGRPLRV